MLQKEIQTGNQRKKNYSMSLSQADLTLRILLTLEFRVTCETFTLEISKPFTYKKKLSQSFTEFINNWFLNHVIPDNLRTLSFQTRLFSSWCLVGYHCPSWRLLFRNSGNQYFCFGQSKSRYQFPNGDIILKTCCTSRNLPCLSLFQSSPACISGRCKA